MFDYNKTYYKVVNEKECHNGYQYHNGLNILPDKFNDDPTASCVKGGFYFTDYEHLCDFFGFGTYIREVTIPEDARVIKDKSGGKWRTDKIILGKKYSIKYDFDKWFDPNKFNWGYSGYLAKYCPEHFDKWFDADKFNWEYSHLLAKYCPEQFEKWWDSNKFDWAYSGYLAKYCPKYFNKWFNPNKYEWFDSGYLAMNCPEHFDKWFDPNKFNWGYSGYLAKYCPEHFDKWFDPDTYNWLNFDYLLKYCSEDLLKKWIDQEMIDKLILKMQIKKDTKEIL